MLHARILIACCALFAGCSAPPHTAPAAIGQETVDLDTGTVDLPVGFTHSRDQGIDSLVGHFTSTDGHLVIHYDIGFLAGVYASQTMGKDIVSSSKATVHGLTTLILVAHWENANHAIVSFPKGGPANFYAELRDDADLEIVKKLAFTFKLKPDGR